MAAVKYQVLYKYTNPNANQFITNDSESDYKQTLELYHQDHKINNKDKEVKLEAENEKSELIIEGNNTSNDNYGMLFKFTGTKQELIMLITILGKKSVKIKKMKKVWF